MTKQSSKNVEVIDRSKWEEALADAEAHLAETRKQLYEWKLVVELCKKRIEEGAPWPGDGETEAVS